jgi:hypothetical protein
MIEGSLGAESVMAMGVLEVWDDSVLLTLPSVRASMFMTGFSLAMGVALRCGEAIQRDRF